MFPINKPYKYITLVDGRVKTINIRPNTSSSLAHSRSQGPSSTKSASVSISTKSTNLINQFLNPKPSTSKLTTTIVPGTNSASKSTKPANRIDPFLNPKPSSSKLTTTIVPVTNSTSNSSKPANLIDTVPNPKPSTSKLGTNTTIVPEPTSLLNANSTEEKEKKNSYNHHSIMNTPMKTNNSSSNQFDDFSNNRIRIGSLFQAEIPALQPYPPPKNYYYPPWDSENCPLLLWKPQTKISDKDLKNYLTLAVDVLWFTEDVALGFLAFHNYNLTKCIGHLNMIKVAKENSVNIDDAHFERFLFTEHKLDMIKAIIYGNKADVNKLFLHYYTKQNSPPTYSEILMINKPEEESIFSWVMRECALHDKKSNSIRLCLSTAIQQCYDNRDRPEFDVTKLESFKQKRAYLKVLRKNTQNVRQHNQMKLNQLKPHNIHYSRALHFLKHCCKNPLWNVYEVLIFAGILEIMKSKIDFRVMSTFLDTKTADQCRKFYGDHAVNIKNILRQYQNSGRRIIEIQRYMGLTTPHNKTVIP